jgi:hypothetical protein
MSSIKYGCEAMKQTFVTNLKTSIFNVFMLGATFILSYQLMGHQVIKKDNLLEFHCKVIKMLLIYDCRQIHIQVSFINKFIGSSLK